MTDRDEETTAESGEMEVEEETPELDALLDYLRRARAFDFSGYKRSSLARRVQRRMQMLSVTTYPDYVDYLEVHPDEFPQLFNMVLINVTGFYRDAGAWAALAQHAQRVIDAKRADEPIRLWSAGCASGEEAYTLAMMLAELIGVDAVVRRAKIYATDLDDGALSQARVATYPPKALESLPPELVEKYFTRAGGSFVFHKELRRSVIFGRHDLMQDAPISRVDILSCRNTLMYFNAEAQGRILSRLHFALAPDGILFLGKAEMLLTHPDLFQPIDLKLRLFARAPREPRARLAVAPPEVGGVGSGGVTSRWGEDRARIFETAFEAVPIGLIVIDGAGRIALINPRAAQLFSLTAHDLGRPFQDLELSYRPAELRSCIDQVRTERRAISLRDVERTQASGEKSFLDIDVSPLLSDGNVVGVQVAFADVSFAHRLQVELRRANVELETAQEEVQSTSEELETTNEELQSTVEELETTNEELQSTNEELETMNEELQSTNEELQTMNEELRQRGEELNEVNAFFGAILASLRSGVTVLDAEMQVRAWNGKMEDLWGLRSEEAVGKHFLNLDIGVPLENLHAPIRACLAGGDDQERTVDCTNRRGKPTRCRVMMTPLREHPLTGVIVSFEELPPA